MDCCSSQSLSTPQLAPSWQKLHWRRARRLGRRFPWQNRRSVAAAGLCATYQKFNPWYEGEGSVIIGNLPDAQFIVPPSITTPPIETPCPPIHLVAE